MCAHFSEGMKRTTASGVQKYFLGSLNEPAATTKKADKATNIPYKPGEMAKIFKRHKTQESSLTLSFDEGSHQSLPYIMPTSKNPNSDKVERLFDLNVIFSNEVRNAMNLHALEFYKYLHELSQQAADPLTQMTSDDYQFFSAYYRNKVVNLIKTAQNTGTEICCERLGYFLLFDRLVQIYNFEPKAFRGIDPLEIKNIFPVDLRKYVYSTFCYVYRDDHTNRIEAKLHTVHKNKCLIYLIICSILVQNLGDGYDESSFEDKEGSYKLDLAPMFLKDLQVKPKVFAEFCEQNGLRVNFQNASRIEVELVAPLIIPKPVLAPEPEAKKKKYKRKF